MGIENINYATGCKSGLKNKIYMDTVKSPAELTSSGTVTM
jgi:hypothetical protein